MISQAQLDLLRRRIAAGEERCPGGSPPKSAVIRPGADVPDLSPDICRTCGQRHFHEDGEFNQVAFIIDVLEPRTVGSVP